MERIRLKLQKAIQGGLADGLPSKGKWRPGYNEALLLKFLHKFFSKADTPWVKLVWENYYNNDKLPG